MAEPILKSKSPSPWRVYFVLLGGAMMAITFGAGYTFGNMNPYMTSYMRHTASSPTLTYTECSWIYVAALATQALVMPLAGVLERRLGSKVTCLLGCWTMSGGVCLSYFTIQHSFGALVLTYGVVFGLGIGMCYMIPMTCAMRWMKDKPGLAAGIVNGGSGGGALIFNMIQTSFINPQNKEVQLQIGQDRYFDQDDVLDRVPSVFLLLGAVYAAMQFVAVLLLTDPPATEATHNAVCVYDHETSEKGIIIGPYEVTSQNDVSTPLLHDDQRKTKTLKASSGPLLHQQEEGMTPREVLKTLDFYLLFFIFLFNGLGVVFLNSLYKAFGLSFINDDVFLSLVGTLSSLFNFLGRVFWGSVADFVSFRVATMMMCTVFTVLVLTLQVTVLASSKALFMVYICGLVGTGSGTYTLIPTAMAKRFGKKHLTTNYGMIFLSQAITAPITVFISESLLTKLGWTGLFFVVAALYYTGFWLTYLFKAKDKNGREI